MRKFLTILAMFMVIKGFVSAQNTEVTYDFRTKSLLEIKAFDYKQPGTLKITNINVKRYKVKIETKQSEYNAEVPEIFNISQDQKKVRSAKKSDLPKDAPDTMTVVSDPIQAEGDIVVFDVSIKPRDPKDSIYGEVRNFKITVPVEGGVKIDFSTGIFLSGLTDKKYTVVPLEKPADTMGTISKDENHSIGSFAFGALMHVSCRSVKNVKPAISFGLGLNSTDITKANVFLGGSLIIGNQTRFVVTLGGTVANVDYLKGKYKTDGTQYLIKNLDENLTEKALRFSWFAGFTYNLTNKKKE